MYDASHITHTRPSRAGAGACWHAHLMPPTLHMSHLLTQHALFSRLLIAFLYCPLSSLAQTDLGVVVFKSMEYASHSVDSLSWLPLCHACITRLPVAHMVFENSSC